MPADPRKIEVEKQHEEEELMNYKQQHLDPESLETIGLLYSIAEPMERREVAIQQFNEANLTLNVIQKYAQKSWSCMARRL